MSILRILLTRQFWRCRGGHHLWQRHTLWDGTTQLNTLHCSFCFQVRMWEDGVNPLADPK